MKPIRVGSIVVHRKSCNSEAANVEGLLGLDNSDAARSHISGITVVEDGLPAAFRYKNRDIEPLGEVGQPFDMVNMVVCDQDALNLPDVFAALL